jgi:hypothetical protein
MTLNETLKACKALLEVSPEAGDLPVTIMFRDDIVDGGGNRWAELTDVLAPPVVLEQGTLTTVLFGASSPVICRSIRIEE